MSLKNKLSRLGNAGPGSAQAQDPPSPPAPAQTADTTNATETPPGVALERLKRLRQELDSLTARQRSVASAPLPPRRPPLALRGDLPGVARVTAHGDIQIVERTLDFEHQHGDVPVCTALRAAGATLAEIAQDDSLADVDPSRLLFLDTETTGLSGGAGTLPFLLGLAWFDEGNFKLSQLLLREPGLEAPMLHFLAERLAWADAIVTYNGKTFDWPLLRGRFVLNRVASPKEPRHLDLLHPCRRVFKRRLPSRRLVAVEAEVMGFVRVGDIDGALIAERYFEYLRGGDPTSLAIIVEHNQNDIIALAALLGFLAASFGSDPAALGRDDPRDRLSLAEHALRRKDTDRALRFAQAAANAAVDQTTLTEALALVARLHKRGGDANAACACLCEALALVKDQPRVAAPLHLALAKLYEHKLKDRAQALAHAEEAVGAEPPEALARRIERLSRRLARAQAS
jgi:hypothetical protein